MNNFNFILEIKYIHNDCQLLVVSNDLIQIWDSHTWELIYTYYHKIRFPYYSFLIDDNHIGLINLEGKFLILDIYTNEIITFIQTTINNSDVYSISYYKNQIAAGYYDGSIRIYDIKTGNLLKTFNKHDTYVNILCYSSDGKHLISVCGYSKIKIWNVDNGNLINTFDEYEGKIVDLQYIPNTNYLLSVTKNSKKIKIWNIQTKQITQIIEHSSVIYNIYSSRYIDKFLL